ncbi:glutathione-disulfide reductase [Piscinibacter sakaiensis]|uniref:Glutathione reductase n=1 Tax=Piscinibacter sakaiensis TaxID=1547922 RepID=A0A0K8NZ04_PISS1|nr:glutathione-disulfide reductase [Piscinibacter sakaiensis]GAP35611.1 glutathione reductase [Piscinibacter sakaiensis]
MDDFDVDLMVLGAGSGGVRAARMAAQRGARVAVAESGPTGGTCVNVGCIPKKLYGHAAHYAEAFEESAGYGWQLGAARLDWGVLKQRRAAELRRLNGVYERLLAEAGVELLRGRARLLGPQQVEVQPDDATAPPRRLRARHVLVATGSRPQRPPIDGAELGVVSDEMFDLPVFPRRLAVVGGGYIACEMASIFHGLGAEVTQLVRGDALLRGFDADIGRVLAAQMQARGVAIRFQAQPVALRRHDGALALQLEDGQAVAADTVLWATGRVPNSADLGLAEAGVALGDDGAVIADPRGATRVPSVHAVGDVTGGPQLTPVALAQAMVLVDRLFGDGGRRFDPALLPTAVFTHPPVGSIGLSEAQAAARHGALRIYETDFKPLKHTLSDSVERCRMKLVVDDASDRVLGLHMVGPDAGEVVQGYAVALGMGATKAQFDATLGIHPTVSEEFVTMRTLSRRVG